eukprot:gene4664-3360_t
MRCSGHFSPSSGPAGSHNGSHRGAAAAVAAAAAARSAATAPPLIDVVVFACGVCEPMQPLTNAATGKAMLQICNRPLIWFCLLPWIKAGFTNFYLCVDEDYAAMDTYLRREFGSALNIYFVVVTPQKMSHEKANEAAGNEGVTTADAVRAFLLFKNQLRDQLVTSQNPDPSSPPPTGPSECEGVPERSTSPPPRGSQQGARGGGTRATQQRAGGVPLGSSASRDAAAAVADVAMALEPRDAMLLHIDTILSNVDIEGFVRNFYVSLSSVMVMLMRPIDSPTSPFYKAEKEAAAASKSGADKRNKPNPKQAGRAPALSPFEYEFSNVVYEEEEESYRQMNVRHLREQQEMQQQLSPGPQPPLGDLTPATAEPLGWNIPPAAAAGAVGVSGIVTPLTAPPSLQHRATRGFMGDVPPTCVGADVYPPHCHRLHILMDTPELQLTVTLPYAAKRPQLCFERGVVDPRVYLVRHWVLQYIAQASEGDPKYTVEDDAIPTLVRSQHAVINKKKQTFLTPERRINYPIPKHWYFAGEDRTRRIDMLNASSSGSLPEKADPLRVFTVVYDEHPQSLRRIYRVHTSHNLIAANQEIIACRSAAAALAATALRQPQSPMTITGASGTAGGTPLVGEEEQRDWQLMPFASPSCPPRQQGLSLLLPDKALTVQHKIGSLGLYVVDSFVQSTIPPNTYVVRSVIGPDVVLHPGARVTDSVVMQAVEVGPGAELHQSLVGNNSQIKDGVKVINTTSREAKRMVVVVVEKRPVALPPPSFWSFFFAYVPPTATHPTWNKKIIYIWRRTSNPNNRTNLHAYKQFPVLISCGLTSAEIHDKYNHEKKRKEKDPAPRIPSSSSEKKTTTYSKANIRSRCLRTSLHRRSSSCLLILSCFLSSTPLQSIRKLPYHFIVVVDIIYIYIYSYIYIYIYIFIYNIPFSALFLGTLISYTEPAIHLPTHTPTHPPTHTHTHAHIYSSVTGRDTKDISHRIPIFFLSAVVISLASPFPFFPLLASLCSKGVHGLGGCVVSSWYTGLQRTGRKSSKKQTNKQANKGGERTGHFLLCPTPPQPFKRSLTTSFFFLLPRLVGDAATNDFVVLEHGFLGTHADVEHIKTILDHYCLQLQEYAAAQAEAEADDVEETAACQRKIHAPDDADDHPEREDGGFLRGGPHPLTSIQERGEIVSVPFDDDADDEIAGREVGLPHEHTQPPQCLGCADAPLRQRRRGSRSSSSYSKLSAKPRLQQESPSSSSSRCSGTQKGREGPEAGEEEAARERRRLASPREKRGVERGRLGLEVLGATEAVGAPFEGGRDASVSASPTSPSGGVLHSEEGRHVYLRSWSPQRGGTAARSASESESRRSRWPRHSGDKETGPPSTEAKGSRGATCLRSARTSSTRRLRDIHVLNHRGNNFLWCFPGIAVCAARLVRYVLEEVNTVVTARQREWELGRGSGAYHAGPSSALWCCSPSLAAVGEETDALLNKSLDTLASRREGERKIQMVMKDSGREDVPDSGTKKEEEEGGSKGAAPLLPLLESRGTSGIVGCSQVELHMEPSALSPRSPLVATPDRLQGDAAGPLAESEDERRIPEATPIPHGRQEEERHGVSKEEENREIPTSSSPLMPRTPPPPPQQQRHEAAGPVTHSPEEKAKRTAEEPYRGDGEGRQDVEQQPTLPTPCQPTRRLHATPPLHPMWTSTTPLVSAEAPRPAAVSNHLDPYATTLLPLAAPPAVSLTSPSPPRPRPAPFASEGAKGEDRIAPHHAAQPSGASAHPREGLATLCGGAGAGGSHSSVFSSASFSALPVPPLSVDSPFAPGTTSTPPHPSPHPTRAEEKLGPVTTLNGVAPPPHRRRSTTTAPTAAAAATFNGTTIKLVFHVLGYSLGGLVVRAALPDLMEEMERRYPSHGAPGVDYRFDIEWRTFFSLCSPHVGSRQSHPKVRWTYQLAGCLEHFCLLPRVVSDMMLKNAYVEGVVYSQRHLTALKRFTKKLFVALTNDRMVWNYSAAFVLPPVERRLLDGWRPREPRFNEAILPKEMEDEAEDASSSCGAPAWGCLLCHGGAADETATQAETRTTATTGSSASKSVVSRPPSAAPLSGSGGVGGREPPPPAGAGASAPHDSALPRTPAGWRDPSGWLLYDDVDGEVLEENAQFWSSLGISPATRLEDMANNKRIIVQYPEGGDDEDGDHDGEAAAMRAKNWITSETWPDSYLPEERKLAVQFLTTVGPLELHVVDLHGAVELHLSRRLQRDEAIRIIRASKARIERELRERREREAAAPGGSNNACPGDEPSSGSPSTVMTGLSAYAFLAAEDAKDLLQHSLSHAHQLLIHSSYGTQELASLQRETLAKQQALQEEERIEHLEQEEAVAAGSTSARTHRNWRESATAATQPHHQPHRHRHRHRQAGGTAAALQRSSPPLPPSRRSSQFPFCFVSDFVVREIIGSTDAEEGDASRPAEDRLAGGGENLSNRFSTKGKRIKQTNNQTNKQTHPELFFLSAFLVPMDKRDEKGCAFTNETVQTVFIAIVPPPQAGRVFYRCPTADLSSAGPKHGETKHGETLKDIRSGGSNSFVCTVFSQALHPHSSFSLSLYLSIYLYITVSKSPPCPEKMLSSSTDAVCHTLEFIILEHGFDATHNDLEHIGTFVDEYFTQKCRREEREEREEEARRAAQLVQVAAASRAAREARKPKPKPKRRSSLDSFLFPTCACAATPALEANDVVVDLPPLSDSPVHHREEGGTDDMTASPHSGGEESSYHHPPSSASAPPSYSAPSTSSHTHSGQRQASQKTIVRGQPLPHGLLPTGCRRPRPVPLLHRYVMLSHPGNDGWKSFSSVATCAERLTDYVVRQVEAELLAARIAAAEASAAAMGVQSIQVKTRVGGSGSCCATGPSSACSLCETVELPHRRRPCGGITPPLAGAVLPDDAGDALDSLGDEDEEPRVRPPLLVFPSSHEPHEAHPGEVEDLHSEEGAGVVPQTTATTQGSADRGENGEPPVIWRLLFHLVGFSMGGLILRAALPALQEALEERYGGEDDPKKKREAEEEAERLNAATPSHTEPPTHQRRRKNPTRKRGGAVTNARYEIEWASYFSLSTPHVGSRLHHPRMTEQYKLANRLDRLSLLPRSLGDMMLKSDYLEVELLKPQYLSSLRRFKQKVFIGALHDGVVWNYSSCFYLPIHERYISEGWVPDGPLKINYNTKIWLFSAVVRREKLLERLKRGDPAVASLMDTAAATPEYADIGSFVRRNDMPWLLFESDEQRARQDNDLLLQSIELTPATTLEEMELYGISVHQIRPPSFHSPLLEECSPTARAEAEDREVMPTTSYSVERRRSGSPDPDQQWNAFQSRQNMAGHRGVPPEMVRMQRRPNTHEDDRSSATLRRRCSTPQRGGFWRGQDWINEASWPAAYLPRERAMAERFLHAVGPIDVHLVDFAPGIERYLNERMRLALHHGTTVAYESAVQVLLQGYECVHSLTITPDKDVETPSAKARRLASIAKAEKGRAKAVKKDASAAGKNSTRGPATTSVTRRDTATNMEEEKGEEHGDDSNAEEEESAGNTGQGLRQRGRSPERRPTKALTAEESSPARPRRPSEFVCRFVAKRIVEKATYRWCKLKAHGVGEWHIDIYIYIYIIVSKKPPPQQRWRYSSFRSGAEGMKKKKDLSTRLDLGTTRKRGGFVVWCDVLLAYHHVFCIKSTTTTTTHRVTVEHSLQWLVQKGKQFDDYYSSSAAAALPCTSRLTLSRSNLMTSRHPLTTDGRAELRSDTNIHTRPRPPPPRCRRRRRVEFVVLEHGLFGSHGSMEHLEYEILAGVRGSGREVVVLNHAGNDGWRRSGSGVEACAARLVSYVLSGVAASVPLPAAAAGAAGGGEGDGADLTFDAVGYSIGGVVIRAALPGLQAALSQRYPASAGYALSWRHVVTICTPHLGAAPTYETSCTLRCLSCLLPASVRDAFLLTEELEERLLSPAHLTALRRFQHRVFIGAYDDGAVLPYSACLTWTRGGCFSRCEGAASWERGVEAAVPGAYAAAVGRQAERRRFYAYTTVGASLAAVDNNTFTGLGWKRARNFEEIVQNGILIAQRGPSLPEEGVRAPSPARPPLPRVSPWITEARWPSTCLPRERAMAIRLLEGAGPVELHMVQLLDTLGDALYRVLADRTPSSLTESKVQEIVCYGVGNVHELCLYPGRDFVDAYKEQLAWREGAGGALAPPPLSMAILPISDAAGKDWKAFTELLDANDSMPSGEREKDIDAKERSDSPPSFSHLCLTVQCSLGGDYRQRRADVKPIILRVQVRIIVTWIFYLSAKKSQSSADTKLHDSIAHFRLLISNLVSSIPFFFLSHTSQYEAITISYSSPVGGGVTLQFSFVSCGDWWETEWHRPVCRLCVRKNSSRGRTNPMETSSHETRTLEFLILEHGFFGHDTCIEHIGYELLREGELLEQQRQKKQTSGSLARPTHGAVTEQCSSSGASSTPRLPPYQYIVINHSGNNGWRSLSSVATCADRLVRCATGEIQAAVQRVVREWRREIKIKKHEQRRHQTQHFHLADNKKKGGEGKNLGPWGRDCCCSTDVCAVGPSPLPSVAASLRVHLVFNVLGFSMGGLVVRAALPALQEWVEKQYLIPTPARPQRHHSFEVHWETCFFLSTPHTGCSYHQEVMNGSGLYRFLRRTHMVPGAAKDMLLMSDYLEKVLHSQECLAALRRFRHKIFVTGLYDFTVWGCSSALLLSPVYRGLLHGHAFQPPRLNTEAIPEVHRNFVAVRRRSYHPKAKSNHNRAAANEAVARRRRTALPVETRDKPPEGTFSSPSRAEEEEHHQHGIHLSHMACGGAVTTDTVVAAAPSAVDPAARDESTDSCDSSHFTVVERYLFDPETRPPETHWMQFSGSDELLLQRDTAFLSAIPHLSIAGSFEEIVQNGILIAQRGPSLPEEGVRAPSPARPPLPCVSPWITEARWPSTCLPRERAMAIRLLEGAGPVELHMVDFIPAMEAYMDQMVRRPGPPIGLLGVIRLKDKMQSVFSKVHQLTVIPSTHYESAARRGEAAQEAERVMRRHCRAAAAMKQRGPQRAGKEASNPVSMPRVLRSVESSLPHPSPSFHFVSRYVVWRILHNRTSGRDRGTAMCAEEEVGRSGTHQPASKNWKKAIKRNKELQLQEKEHKTKSTGTRPSSCTYVACIRIIFVRTENAWKTFLISICVYVEKKVMRRNNIALLTRGAALLALSDPHRATALPTALPFALSHSSLTAPRRFQHCSTGVRRHLGGTPRVNDKQSLPLPTFCVAADPESCAVLKEMLPTVFKSGCNVIFAPTAADYAALKASKDPVIVFIHGPTGHDCIKTLCDDIGASSRRVKLIYSISAGVDGYRVTQLQRELEGIPFCNARGCFASILAEHVIFAMLHFNRFPWRLIEAKAQRKWEKFSMCRLGGKSLGIVGYGNIGQQCGRLAVRMGMNVVGIKRTAAVPGAKEVDEHGVTVRSGSEALAQVLREADFVLGVLPATPDTKGFFNRDVFVMMKPSAVFINIGRGVTQKEDDVVEALSKGVIRGAALDVFEVEPLPPTSPLWAVSDDKVLLSPHCADVTDDITSISVQRGMRIAKEFVETGTVKAYTIDVSKGY